VTLGGRLFHARAAVSMLVWITMEHGISLTYHLHVILMSVNC